MKAITDFQTLIGRIAYKPGWRLGVFNTHGGGFYLQVRFEALEPGTTVVGEQNGRKWFLSAHATDGEVVQTALAAILAAEEHEAREFFKFDGRAIFGPHFNLQKLVELCDQADATEVRANGDRPFKCIECFALFPTVEAGLLHKLEYHQS